MEINAEDRKKLLERYVSKGGNVEDGNKLLDETKIMSENAATHHLRYYNFISAGEAEKPKHWYFR